MIQRIILFAVLIIINGALSGQDVFKGKIEYGVEVEDNPTGGVTMAYTTDGTSWALEFIFFEIPITKIVYNSSKDAGYIVSFDLDNGSQGSYMEAGEFNSSPPAPLDVTKVEDVKGRIEVSGFKCKQKLVYIKGRSKPISIFYTNKIKVITNHHLPTAQLQVLVDGLIVKIIDPTEKPTSTIWIKHLDQSIPNPNLFINKIPSEYKVVSKSELYEKN